MLVKSEMEEDVNKWKIKEQIQKPKRAKSPANNKSIITNAEQTKRHGSLLYHPSSTQLLRAPADGPKCRMMSHDGMLRYLESLQAEPLHGCTDTREVLQGTRHGQLFVFGGWRRPVDRPVNTSLTSARELVAALAPGVTQIFCATLPYVPT